jgi:DNA-directed RNA polymerase subunit K/omega
MKENEPDMKELPAHDLDLDEAVELSAPPPRQAVVEDDGPQVPKPFDRAPDVDRKIRSAVDRMLEDVQNPYETVIVAAQEARRLNERRLKARSILNQTMEHVEELVPDVPFLPRPVEDDDPEVKPTNEALERLALGLVEARLDDKLKQMPSYYAGEIDFPLFPDKTEEAEGSADGA